MIPVSCVWQSPPAGEESSGTIFSVFRNFPAADVDRAIELSALSRLIEERGADYLCGENGKGYFYALYTVAQ